MGNSSLCWHHSEECVCIVRWIDTREVTGICNRKWWNPLHRLCNRVRKVCNKSSHLQSFEEVSSLSFAFSLTIPCSLPLSVSPHITHPLFSASELMCGMTACQWSDLFPKQHCERLSMHFVLNCFNEAVEINLRASWSRPPDIVF